MWGKKKFCCVLSFGAHCRLVVVLWGEIGASTPKWSSGCPGAEGACGDSWLMWPCPLVILRLPAWDSLFANARKTICQARHTHIPCVCAGNEKPFGDPPSFGMAPCRSSNYSVWWKRAKFMLYGSNMRAISLEACALNPFAGNGPLEATRLQILLAIYRCLVLYFVFVGGFCKKWCQIQLFISST